MRHLKSWLGLCGGHVRSEMCMSLSFHAGQEDYDSLRQRIYFDTDVVLMCFAIDSPDSLVNVEKKWMREVKLFCPNGTAGSTSLFATFFWLFLIRYVQRCCYV